ncbi:MAG: co-chaperone DjlA [Acidiferrobacterales bacterium]|nr:co-chaperone DjlA [Acidiferrobacterales bacterium]
MAWWGKVIGGVLGSMALGPIGIILGVAVGNMFDKRRASVGSGSWNMQERMQTVFFTTTFSVLGYIAKVDGHVSPQEVRFAEEVMRNMDLDVDMREVAIQLFRQGKQPEFELNPILKQFNRECGNRKNLKRMFINILLSGALCDGVIDDVENEAIRDIADRIGISRREFAELYNEVSGRSSGAGASQQSLSDDYKMLGLSENADDDEIKRAYRRKMSRLHPDKLVSQGLPDEMIEMATEKTKQIRAAYDRIRERKKYNQDA